MSALGSPPASSQRDSAIRAVSTRRSAQRPSGCGSSLKVRLWKLSKCVEAQYAPAFYGKRLFVECSSPLTLLKKLASHSSF
ncbi:hypothetical protein CHARACLAT_016546 [Characodon lateralis]|uniref:Uncharacterized protein n=1 Tax=Characodon lateralis TaxID=208331 RepID=A0ABU7EEF4_9TELE|nr:hypothetical protein [Characodon lateralis]